jgi:hypothetical protein
LRRRRRSRSMPIARLTLATAHTFGFMEQAPVNDPGCPRARRGARRVHDRAGEALPRFRFRHRPGRKAAARRG